MVRFIIVSASNWESLSGIVLKWKVTLSQEYTGTQPKPPPVLPCQTVMPRPPLPPWAVTVWTQLVQGLMQYVRYLDMVTVPGVMGWIVRQVVLLTLTVLLTDLYVVL